MNKYYVELDGVSIITAQFEVEKGDLLTLHENGEVNHYRVRGLEGKNLTLRLVKTLSNADDGVKYQLVEDGLYFENRLSKNQIIVVNDSPYKVLEIEKKTNKLTLEEQERIVAHALHGVYASRVSEGLTVRDREKGNYLAEEYFKNWGEAIMYVSQERSKGRKVSL